MIEFILHKEFIHLIQLLKATDLVNSGGDAQIAVINGLVKVNGEIEYRKRYKLVKNDIVEYQKNKIQII